MFDKDKEIQKFIKGEFKKGKTKEEIERELKKKGQSFYINNLSSYPDTSLFQKYKKLHYILIVVLIVLIPLRLMSVPLNTFGFGWYIFLLVLSASIPILLIYYLRTHRKDAYIIVSALGLIGLSRSIRFDYESTNPLFMLALFLYLIGIFILISMIVLSFFLYEKLFPKKKVD